MQPTSKISRWLARTNGFNFALFAITAAFITY